MPPRGLIPATSRRTVVPYLYTDQEIAALVRAAGELSGPLRAATYQTLIRLLAVTGMRVGEAIGLDREDLDEQTGVLTIRGTKFGKSRQLPLHPSAVVGLRGYLELDVGRHRAGHPAELPREHPVDLRHAGLVRSQRGSDGGYWLAKPADEISVADIMRAVDGPLAGVRGQRPRRSPTPARPSSSSACGSRCATTCAPCRAGVGGRPRRRARCPSGGAGSRTTPRPGSAARRARRFVARSRRQPHDVALGQLQLARPRRA